MIVFDDGNGSVFERPKVILASDFPSAVIPRILMEVKMEHPASTQGRGTIPVAKHMK